MHDANMRQMGLLLVLHAFGYKLKYLTGMMFDQKMVLDEK